VPVASPRPSSGLGPHQCEFHLLRPIAVYGLVWQNIAVCLAANRHLRLAQVPVLFLRFNDKLTWKQSLQFLGLDRVDLRGLFIVLPVYCALFALAALPYMQFMWNPLERWLQSVPASQMPAYTIFKGGPEGLYSFPPIALLFLFIGNFLGEELYFRGYLMKKIAFLGNSAWIVNSILFALYHLWQIPQTWPLVGLVLAIGLLMQLRKDLYVLVAFHFFINMWLTYGDYPLARLLHLAK
jgi:membrane protease YdiL (CAAX protease family)